MVSEDELEKVQKYGLFELVTLCSQLCVLFLFLFHPLLSTHLVSFASIIHDHTPPSFYIVSCEIIAIQIYISQQTRLLNLWLFQVRLVSTFSAQEVGLATFMVSKWGPSNSYFSTFHIMNAFTRHCGKNYRLHASYSIITPSPVKVKYWLTCFDGSKTLAFIYVMKLKHHDTLCNVSKCNVASAVCPQKYVAIRYSPDSLGKTVFKIQSKFKLNLLGLISASLPYIIPILCFVERNKVYVVFVYHVWFCLSFIHSSCHHPQLHCAPLP